MFFSLINHLDNHFYLFLYQNSNQRMSRHILIQKHDSSGDLLSNENTTFPRKKSLSRYRSSLLLLGCIYNQVEPLVIIIGIFIVSNTLKLFSPENGPKMENHESVVESRK